MKPAISLVSTRKLHIAKSLLLLIIFITPLGCKDFKSSSPIGDMTSMTFVKNIADELNKEQSLSTTFLDSAMRVFDRASNDEETQALLALAYRDLGWRNMDQSRFGIAFIAFDKGLQASSAANVPKELLEAHLALGALFGRFQDYQRAHNHYQQALAIAKKLPDTATLLHIYHEVAKNELHFKNLRNAETIALEGLQNSNAKYPKEQIHLYNVLALSLARQEKFEDAIRNFEKAIQLDKSRKKNLSGFLFGNIGDCYLYLRNYEKALEQFQLDFQYSMYDDSYNSAYGASLGIAESYNYLNRPNEALRAFQLADSIKISRNIHDPQPDASILLLSILSKLNQPKAELKALQDYTILQEKWMQIKDNQNKQQITALISINDALRTIEELRFEATKAKRNNLYLIFGTMGLFLILVLSLYFIIHRNQQIQTQKRISALTAQAHKQELQLLKQEQDISINTLRLKEAESQRKEQEIQLLRSRNEHQILAKEYYNDIKNNLLNSLLEAIHPVENLPQDVQKRVEKALFEINTLESNSFIDSVSNDEVSADFIQKLERMYPELSGEEIKLCTYIRLNLSTKEIAQLKSITVPGVNKSRNRLRKKFGLSPDENLFDFLIKI